MRARVSTNICLTLLVNRPPADEVAALKAVMAVTRSSVAADGGDIELVSADVAAGELVVQLSGACGSCAASDDTLAAGVTHILTQRVPWVHTVVGEVDDSLDCAASAEPGTGAWTPKPQRDS